ncbi:MAG: extracellular solute-binding protein [Lachnospiraceae bacterium]|jgi:raffinose/stachyose/melibiose transport system substrate-binding protein|nr:extracellular solute-binding protein [Lachnospiraceae bacterium]
MKRKWLSILLAAGMALSLTACGGQGQAGDEANGNSAEAVVEEPEEGQPEEAEANDKAEEASKEPGEAETEGEQITLSMWHIQTNKDDLTAKALLDAIELYEETHPNVKIVQDATQGEQYKVKIRTAGASDELPDIFFAWGYSFAEDFAKTGKVLSLDSWLEDGTREKIKPGLLSVLSYDDAVYGLPVDFSGMLMYYNKTVFEENGLEIPETYEELVEVTDAFKQKGISPMIMGGKAMWPLTAMFEDFSIRIIGADKCLDVVSLEDTIHQDGFVKAAEYLQNFLADNTLTQDSMTMIPPEANTKFAAGGIPMTYNGTWSIGVFEGEGSQVKDQLVAKPFPLIEGQLENPEEYVGASLSGYMVSAETEYPDVAVEAVKFITQEAAKNLYQSGAGLPAWNVEVDETRLNSLIISVNELYGGLTKGVANWDTLLAADFVEDYKNMTTMLTMGDITPEEYAQEMSEILGK